MGNLIKAALAAFCLLLLSGCNIDVVVLGEGQVNVVSSNAEPCSNSEHCLNGGYNRLIRLQAEPADGFVFTGWAGDCEGEETDTCTVRSLSNKTVVATFKTQEYLMPLMDYSDAFFFSGPWPTDLKRKADGRLNMAGYPFKNSLFEGAVKRDAARVKGFSRNDAIYIPVATDAPTWHPSQNSLEWPGVKLVNLSPESPHYLDTIPVFGALYRDDNLQKDALLRLTPDHGYSLDAATTYGLIMLEYPVSNVRYPVRKGAAMTAILNGQADGLLQQHWTLVSDYLTEHTEFAPEEVAAFTVFTTQDISPNLAKVREFLAQRNNDSVLDHVLNIDPLTGHCDPASHENPEDYADLFELTIRLPFFLKGKPPFLFSGGRLNLNADGELQESTAGTETKVILVMPCGEPPEAGYPIEVQALHTGGSLFDYMYDEIISQRNFHAVKLFVAAPYTEDRVYDGGLANLNWLEELLDIDLFWIIAGLGDFNPVNWNAIEPQYLQYASDMVFTYYVGSRISEYFYAEGDTDFGKRTKVDDNQLTFSGMSLGAMAAVNANTLYQNNQNLAVSLMPRPNIQHMNNMINGLLHDNYINESSVQALEWVLGIDLPADLNDPTLSILQTVIDRIDTANHLDYMGDKNVLMALSNFDDGLHGGEASYQFAYIFDRRFGINPVTRDLGDQHYFPISGYNESEHYSTDDWISDHPTQLVLPAYDGWGMVHMFPWDMTQEGFYIR